MVKFNITIEIHESEVTGFEAYLRDNLKVIDSRILPDTQELYDTDSKFRELIKTKKQVNDLIADYVNKHN